MITYYVGHCAKLCFQSFNVIHSDSEQKHIIIICMSTLYMYNKEEDSKQSPANDHVCIPQ